MQLNSSCNFNSQSVSCSSSTTNIAIPLEKLLSSPDNIEFNGNKFELDVYLSRDLSQSISNNPKPVNPEFRCLQAEINVIDKSNLRLPLSYKIQRLWVIYNKNVWQTDIVSYALQVPVKFYGGPPWPEGQSYYTVIQVTDNNGKVFFLKSKELEIRFPA